MPLVTWWLCSMTWMCATDTCVSVPFRLGTCCCWESGRPLCSPPWRRPLRVRATSDRGLRRETSGAGGLPRCYCGLARRRRFKRRKNRRAFECSRGCLTCSSGDDSCVMPRVLSEHLPRKSGPLSPVRKWRACLEGPGNDAGGGTDSSSNASRSPGVPSGGSQGPLAAATAPRRRRKRRNKVHPEVGPQLEESASVQAGTPTRPLTAGGGSR